jgi:TRAP-type mannitol/chloroaromatic compound transport system substrate-binding protein
MQKEGKVKVRTFPKDVLDAFRKANDELLTEFSAKSPEAREVIESQKAFLAKARVWTKITDEDYLKLR